MFSVPTKGANPPAGPIPPGPVTFGKVLVSESSGQPGPGPARRWSALADPAERAPVPGHFRQRESGRCWQSHQVPPGQSLWCWRRQDEQTIYLLWPAAASAAAGHNAQGRLIGPAIGAS